MLSSVSSVYFIHASKFFLSDQEFIGETFRLMEKEDVEELGIKMADHLEQLLDKVSSGRAALRGGGDGVFAPPPGIWQILNDGYREAGR